MIRLIPYELKKAWSKQSFRILMFVLVIINVLIIWYVNIPNEWEPNLSAYKSFGNDISSLSEVEKYEFVLNKKEEIDGIVAVNNILNLQAQGSESKKTIANQELLKMGGSYNKYLEIYNNGNYLQYCSSIYLEKKFIDEMFNEIKLTIGYGEYLQSVQESKEALSGISIFSNRDNDSFSSRNIEKSSRDHANLTAENISWYPSKGMKIISINVMTDMLFLLAIVLFVGIITTEEKEKGLFFITKPTVNGESICIIAKIAALAMHSIIIGVLLYSSNMLFAYFTTGIGNITARLQSIPMFIESSLNINIAIYLVLMLTSKIIVVFLFGLVIMYISIISTKSFMPQLVGFSIVLASWIIFKIIPAYSNVNYIKFLSLFGLLDSKTIFGEYLNFNMFGYPISRFLFVSAFVFMAVAISILLVLTAFKSEKCNIISKNNKIGSFIKLKPKNNLFVHEAYKILFMNKSAFVMLMCIVFIGYINLGKNYNPSVNEQYYRNIMLILEGEINDEKEKIIIEEQNKYDEAFAEIQRIDDLLSAGEIDKRNADDMKSKWYGDLYFYKSFCRVMEQYEHIKGNEGQFIYDTGYRYLFGKMDDRFIINYLLLIFCSIFSFGNVMPMEYNKSTWNLLSSTKKGKQEIIINKIFVCFVSVIILVIIPWIFQIIAILKEYPLNQWGVAIKNIPIYFDCIINVPVWMLLFILIAAQIISVSISSAIVLLISIWRKNYLQTMFISVFIFGIPPALVIMGFEIESWIPLYQLYVLFMK